MSSEYSMYFENFLNENFDTAFASNYPEPFDTQVQPDGDDFQIPNLPAGFSDNFHEALDQLNELDPTDSAPLPQETYLGFNTLSEVT